MRKLFAVMSVVGALGSVAAAESFEEVAVSAHRITNADTTPITVADKPLTRTALPITAGSAPKRLFHTPLLNTMTGAAPSRSSSALKVRPSVAFSPMILNPARAG